MKQKVLTILPLLSMLLLQSCFFSPPIKGDGNVVTESRDIEEFEGIHAKKGINLYITQGENTSVTIEADENLHNSITTEVEGDNLIISNKNSIKNAKAFKVHVTTPKLEEIKALAGCNVYSQNKLEQHVIDISAMAGSNIKLDVDVIDLEVSASAGSNINLSGNVKNLNGKANSGSNIKAKDLKSMRAHLKVSSGSNFWTSTSQQLEASASSGGNIFYYGNPSNTEVHKSSGGNVLKR